jgi:hypothetical protein
VTTVRSKVKGDQILAAHASATNEQLSYVLVPDIAQDGAFDDVSHYLDYDGSKGQRLIDARDATGCPS